MRWTMPRHVHLMEGRAEAASIYPKQLCQAVSTGIKAQQEIIESSMCGMDLLDLGIPGEQVSANDEFHNDDIESGKSSISTIESMKISPNTTEDSERVLAR